MAESEEVDTAGVMSHTILVAADNKPYPNSASIPIEPPSEKLRNNDPSAADLQREAEVFSEYLTGRHVSQVLLDRYVAACRVRLPEMAEQSGASAVELSVRHPFLLPALDAVSALLRPKSVLREKLLIMAAILEATPEFAPQFLPESCSGARLLVRVTACVVTTTVKVIAGVVILIILRGRL
jgi:hypothetical protein